MQLPATVISERAAQAGYNVSLFRRLQSAGYPVTVLDTQVRVSSGNVGNMGRLTGKHSGADLHHITTSGSSKAWNRILVAAQPANYPVTVLDTQVLVSQFHRECGGRGLSTGQVDGHAERNRPAVYAAQNTPSGSLEAWNTGSWWLRSWLATGVCIAHSAMQMLVPHGSLHLVSAAWGCRPVPAC